MANTTATEIPRELTVTILGCGSLGTAILKGILLHARVHGTGDTLSLHRVVACVRSAESVERVGKTALGAPVHVSVLQGRNVEGVASADVVVLACKPKDVQETLKEPGLRDALAGKLLISTAVGVPADKVERMLGVEDKTEDGKRCWVLQAVPSVACALSQSMTIVAKRQTPLPASQGALARMVIHWLGASMEVDSTSLSKAIVLSSATPAFNGMMMHWVSQDLHEDSLSQQDAWKIAAQAMKGAGELALAGVEPVSIAGSVAKPGGITSQGLDILDEKKVGQFVSEAMLRMVGAIEKLSGA